MAEYLTELQLFEASKEWLEVAVAHRWIGECLVELGDCERALEHQQQYLDIAIECNSTLEQQRAYATIGRVHFQHAQQSHNKAVDHLVAEAESAFKQSLNLVGKLSDDIPELEIAEMKSRLLMNLGKHDYLLYYLLNNKIRTASYLTLLLTSSPFTLRETRVT